MQSSISGAAVTPFVDLLFLFVFPAVKWFYRAEGVVRLALHGQPEKRVKSNSKAISSWRVLCVSPSIASAGAKLTACVGADRVALMQ
jgi:hypothetical protein